MHEILLKRFDHPAEIRNSEHDKSEPVRLGGMDTGRPTSWKWPQQVSKALGFILSVAALLCILPCPAQAHPRRSVRVAICQILVIDSDREGNFRRIEDALEQAQAQHAQIAVFPESSILGWENPDAHRLAEPIPGKDSDRIAALARKYNLMIAIGLDEKAGDRLYDSAILVDKTGKLLWRHRKINVLPELMTPPYSQGRPEDIGVVDTEFGRIAVLICADTFTDAFAERLKALKPDLMLVPYGWAATNDKWPEHSRELEALVRRRAAQVQCPMAGVDLVGEMTHGPWAGWTYGGSSFVADGEGRLLLTARDRNTDLRVLDLAVGSLAK